MQTVKTPIRLGGCHVGFVMRRLNLTLWSCKYCIWPAQFYITPGKQCSLIKCDISRTTTKPTKWPVRPAKTLTSLCIRSVWSESSLTTWRRFGSLATHIAHSKDSIQTGWKPRLIWVFTGCTGPDSSVGRVSAPGNGRSRVRSRAATYQSR